MENKPEPKEDWRVLYADEFGELDRHLEMFITREIAAAEQRGADKFEDSRLSDFEKRCSKLEGELAAAYRLIKKMTY